MSAPIYAIGDIHGQREMLEETLEWIHADGGQDAQVVFLGDYVDRGPDCRGVLDLLIKGQADGRNWTCLMGNHDRMFSMFLEEYPRNDACLLVGYHWLHEKIGGIETLCSYGVKVPERTRIYEVHAAARDAVPQSHQSFLKSLPSHHEQGDMLFVHAGIRPGVPLDEQTEDDKIWIRQEFLNDPRPHPWLVVHGHTHVPQAEHRGNRINLDSGAGFGCPLTAAVLEQGNCWRLTRDGRKRLEPA